jgi:uroporphyrinogen-III synthase
MLRQSRAPAAVRPAVILTRPAAQSARFAAQLHARLGEGFDILCSPLMEPEFPATRLPDGPFEALILTSGTALEALPHLTGFLPPRAFCVGRRTADAARAHGFDAVSADGDAEALLALLLDQRPQGGLLHLHGEEPRGDLVVRLRAAGLRAEGLCVYRQRPRSLAAAVIARLEQPGYVLFPVFSPQSAQSLAEALRVLPRPAAMMQFTAISRATAEPLLRFCLGPVSVAAQPDAGAMLDLLDPPPWDNPCLEAPGSKD